MDSPRELYLAACTQIAGSLTPLGFKFARSGPHAKRKDGEFTCRVSFQSSHNNIAGRYVALWMHAHVYSKRLADWRVSQSHAIRSDDFVAGGLIGNLMRPTELIEWNLVGSASAVEEATAAVHTLALPYFGVFSDIPGLCQLLQREELPAMPIGQAIEFLLCFADRAAANAAVSSFFHSRPDLLADYHRHLEEFRQRGLPKDFMGSGYAKQLAFATMAYDLTPFHAA